jgi:hypothetical protein
MGGIVRATERTAAVALAAALWIGVAFAQKPKSTPKKPPAKPPTVGAVGTEQMKGGDGLFGVTYTFENSGGYMYNLTLVSAEYSIARHNISPDETIVPKADEKLLILHLRAQNPAPGDMYFSGNFVTFATVAKDDQTRNHNDNIRLVSGKQPVATSLKPGQKFPDELVAVCVVPANGPVPKLILNMGRKGTKDEVTRYFLGKAPNTIKPLATPFADTSDPSGATALKEISVKPGTFYPAGYYDIRLDSVAFVSGPIGDVNAGEENRFLVATVTVVNKSWGGNYFNNSLSATLLTVDDEKTTLVGENVLKGKRDERWEGRKIEPEETVTLRLLFAVPKDVTGKTLKIAEVLDNTGTLGRAYVFDISGVR